jgi:chromate transporter
MDTHTASTPPPKPSFREAQNFWVKLGFISFGGPAGQIAIMHEYVVTQKKWISNSRFFHALNYCMLLPGPEAQQLATYIGWLLHGRIGGLAAGIFFVLPSMFILLGLSVIYVSYGNVPWIHALFTGLKPAVIAIVILALYKIGKRSLKSIFHVVAAAAAFVCIFFLNIAFPLIILGAIIGGAVAGKLWPGILKMQDGHAASGDDGETGYYLNQDSALPEEGFSPLRLAKQIAVALLLWVLPFVLFYLLTSDPAFWRTLSVFFTQAAFVTFGGAYAVLPYVAQVSVEKLGWLSSLQMVDGLALGETTPGPLIMVLAYVGFMAGYNHYQGSLLMGAAGLGAATFFTFLPCFLFIFAGAPVIERSHGNKRLREILEFVTAAVVGVMLNLTIYLGGAVLFPNGLSWLGLDYISLAWVVVSFVAMYRFKVGMLTWIGASALFGLAAFWFSG